MVFGSPSTKKQTKSVTVNGWETLWGIAIMVNVSVFLGMASVMVNVRVTLASVVVNVKVVYGDWLVLW